MTLAQGLPVFIHSQRHILYGCFFIFFALLYRITVKTCETGGVHDTDRSLLHAGYHKFSLLRYGSLAAHDRTVMDASVGIIQESFLEVVVVIRI